MKKIFTSIYAALVLIYVFVVLVLHLIIGIDLSVFGFSSWVTIFSPIFLSVALAITYAWGWFIVALIGNAVRTYRQDKNEKAHREILAARDSITPRVRSQATERKVTAKKVKPKRRTEELDTGEDMTGNDILERISQVTGKGQLDENEE